MKKELTERLLNGQATPEEEHLIAQRLQEEEDMDSWLTEDETEEYERIVRQHRARRHLLRWATAAAIVVLIAAGALVLWPKEQFNDIIAEQEKEVTKPDVRDVEPTVAVAMPAKFATGPKTIRKRMKRQTAADTTDSLQYYIARLEKELENVNESTYTAKAEEVLRADARLQKLVQRIMVGELSKDNMPSEALNTNKTTEEQP